MQETLDRIVARRAAPRAARVNLERPVTLADRLGGHLVQGHVDGTGGRPGAHPGRALGGRARRRCRPALARYVVEKGSITVDGVSLTVVEVGPDWFTVSLIPTTLAVTTLGRTPAGGTVNLEVDVIAKYVEKLVAGGRTADRESRHERAADRAGPPSGGVRLDAGRRRHRRDRAPAGPSSSSTTRTARTRATSIFAAAKATPELVGFMIRHTSGVICVPMPGPRPRPARAAADDVRQRGPRAAPRTRSRSTPATASPPASPPPTGRTPSRCWSTARPSRTS